MVDPFNLVHGGKDSSSSGSSNLWDEIISKYSYKPQYTAQTEKGLYDLFNQTTGLSGGGVNAIPFDIGLPTTGLYDALTRGIKEQYLGTPGGPEGGRLADTRSYYNNLGIPEYAANQERLGNQDLNNSLLDTAAKINESQKDRLTNVLGLGANIGNNLYSQNLGQHRANAGLASGGAMTDLGLQQSINASNQEMLSNLANLAVTGAGYYFGGPAGGAAASQVSNNFFSNPNAPSSVSRQGGVPSLFGEGKNYGSANDPQSGLSKLIY